MGKRSGRFYRGMVFGMILGVATVFTFVFFVGWLFLTGGLPKKGEGIGAYPEIFELNLVFSSTLDIFPKEIPEDVVETDFYYYYRYGFDNPSYDFYLRCTYEPEDYIAEVERLKERCHEGTLTYRYPAYCISESEDYSYTYEYALLTGENQIAYICMSFENGFGVEFPREYLPKEIFRKNREEDEKVLQDARDLWKGEDEQD